MNRFDKKLLETWGSTLQKAPIEILQLNVGKLCNLSCAHCHVEAGPTRTEENMDASTAKAVVKLMDQFDIKTLDITGGAPELNPHFKFLVQEAKKRGIHIIDRCNLTVFFEAGQEETPSFLAQHQVEIAASLPCYSKENVDKQRGNGTFSQSIEALQWLNELGYGSKSTNLQLNLVYNPVGPHLPPSQTSLEKDYKKKLLKDFEIVFNHLYTITNMPITRYAKYLKAFGQLEDYQKLLVRSFNESTLEGLMCLNTLSIGWDGKIYDCDFNQMLKMQMKGQEPLTIFNLGENDLGQAPILTAEHCFGCTAGAGSSCQGALN